MIDGSDGGYIESSLQYTYIFSVKLKMYQIKSLPKKRELYTCIF